MHLIYLDESGNTGMNLADHNQPVFVLAALIIAEECWQEVDQAIRITLDTFFPDRPFNFEIHATELNNPRDQYLRQIPVIRRLEFRDELFKLAVQYKLKVVYRSIEKKRFQNWLLNEFGAGIILNPHIAAFPLVARVVDQYLSSLAGTQRGMFIIDENKEVLDDLEKSIQQLRMMEGVLQLQNIVEKGFFIDSRKSRLLQLCDLCAFAVRRKEEAQLGIKLNNPAASWISLADPLIHRGDEAFKDVTRWLSEQNKKGRPGA